MVDKIEIKDKTTFTIGLLTMAYQIGFELMSMTIFRHVWPLCIFGYAAAILILYAGIKGERPPWWKAIVILIGVSTIIAILFVLSANGIILWWLQMGVVWILWMLWYICSARGHAV